MILAYQRFRCIAALLVCLALYTSSVACVKHVPLTPAQDFTLSSKQILDTVAHANQEAQTIAEQLEALKQPWFTIAAARNIITYTREVALVIAEANNAVNQGTSVEARTAAVLAALSKIQQLPASVQVFVDNGNSNGQITGLIAAIQNTIQLAKTFAQAKGAP